MEVLRGRRGTSRSRPSCGKKAKHESHQERSNKCTEERARVLMYNVVIHVSHPLVVVASQRGRSTLPGGGSLEISGFGAFFFSCSQARRVLYSLRPQHPAKIFIRICCRICGARAMTLATPIDRLSVKARARGSEGTQTVEPRSGERDPAPRRATPTSDPDERGQGPFDRYVSPCEASCLFLFGGGGRVGECPEGVWSRGSDLSALASWRPPPPRGRRRPRRPRGMNKKSMCLLAGDLNFQTSVVNLQLQKVQKRKRFFWTVLGRTLGSVFWTKIREWYLRPGVATTTQGPGRCPRGVLMNTRTPRWLH